jgi:hypothetical protein
MNTARLRWGQRGSRRCEDCGSYSLVAGQCHRCGWLDPEYEPPAREELSEQELASRLAEPCTPSSDISTFMTPDEITQPQDMS